MKLEGHTTHPRLGVISEIKESIPASGGFISDEPDLMIDVPAIPG